MALSSIAPRPPASAMAVPDMPEKMMLARMLAWPSPPVMWPTALSANSKMRRVMPPVFMMLPARMKKGTAMSGNESPMPIAMRCTATIGLMPAAARYRSELINSANAIGTRRTISRRNEPSRRATIMRHRPRRGDGGSGAPCRRRA
jgi:hypothetical protein